MFIQNINTKRSFDLITHKAFHYIVLSIFIASQVFGIAPQKAIAQSALNLPQPGTMVTTSPAFVPPMLTGLIIHQENPFQFDFVVDSGNEKLNEDELKSVSNKLIRYFLASLAIPENELWVNLSPYEKDRIIPDAFGKTEMGRDLLAQDYMLKQITASLMNPETMLGAEFWNKVYAQAQEKFGTTEVPVNTFNKVWIVPEKAEIFENKDRVFVVSSHLKVLLEEDYLAMESSLKLNKSKSSKTVEEELSSSIIREIIIPAIEKEVNEGKNFAQLRQIYNSFILSAWYKKNLKQSILNQSYSDKKKIEGIELGDKNVKDKIYDRYLEAFKSGVFDFIKEDYDEKTQEVIPRKYFSGGAVVKDVSSPVKNEPEVVGDLAMVSADFDTPDRNIENLLKQNNAISHPIINNTIDPSMMAEAIEKNLMKGLNIDEEKVYRSTTEINGKSIDITQYKNERDEPVPFARVGKFVIVQKKYFDELDDEVKDYPFLIVLQIDNFSTNFDYRHTYSWSGETFGVLASMLVSEDVIQGADFVDAGAGRTGILAIAAKMLGARKVTVIEQNLELIEQLEKNLKNNGVLEYEMHRKPIQSIDSISGMNLVVASNLPYFGLKTGRGEETDALEKLLGIIQEPALTIISGGRNSDREEAEKLLEKNGAKGVKRISVSKELGGTSFSNMHYYPTLIADFQKPEQKLALDNAGDPANQIKSEMETEQFRFQDFDVKPIQDDRIQYFWFNAHDNGYRKLQEVRVLEKGGNIIYWVGEGTVLFLKDLRPNERIYTGNIAHCEGFGFKAVVQKGDVLSGVAHLLGPYATTESINRFRAEVNALVGQLPDVKKLEAIVDYFRSDYRDEEMAYLEEEIKKRFPFVEFLHTPTRTREIRTSVLISSKAWGINVAEGLGEEFGKEITSGSFNPDLLEDKASTVKSQGDAKKGGIDFNPANLHIQSHGQKVELPLPSNIDVIGNIEINGLVPFIFNITPVTNLHNLLGEIADERSENIAQN